MLTATGVPFESKPSARIQADSHRQAAFGRSVKSTGEVLFHEYWTAMSNVNTVPKAPVGQSTRSAAFQA